MDNIENKMSHKKFEETMREIEKQGKEIEKKFKDFSKDKSAFSDDFKKWMSKATKEQADFWKSFMDDAAFEDTAKPEAPEKKAEDAAAKAASAEEEHGLDEFSNPAKAGFDPFDDGVDDFTSDAFELDGSDNDAPFEAAPLRKPLDFSDTRLWNSFRGWAHEDSELSHDKGKWVYGDLVAIGDFSKIVVHEGEDTDIVCTVENESIGQCTGLENDAGQMIYEGDIVRREDNKLFTVRYSAAVAGFCLTDPEVPEMVEFGLADSYSLEVVGNVVEGIINDVR